MSDQDGDDPPDQMAADYVFSFTIADLAGRTLALHAGLDEHRPRSPMNDDWSGVPGVAGFLGQDITTATAVDPQTLLTTSTLAGDVDVIANQTNPNTLATGGVAEFHITDPVVALQGSGTADAPYVLFNFATTGLSNIIVAYNLRDIDGSVDNADPARRPPVPDRLDRQLHEHPGRLRRGRDDRTQPRDASDRRQRDAARRRQRPAGRPGPGHDDERRR